MAVPEASVDEHGEPVSGEHQVGRTGKIASAQPKAQALRVGQPSNGELGRRVSTTNSRHEGAAALGAPPIHLIRRHIQKVQPDAGQVLPRQLQGACRVHAAQLVDHKEGVRL